MFPTTKWKPWQAVMKVTRLHDSLPGWDVLHLDGLTCLLDCGTGQFTTNGGDGGEDTDRCIDGVDCGERLLSTLRRSV